MHSVRFFPVRRGALWIGSATLALVFSTLAPALPVSAGSGPVILPPNAQAYGASYAEWSARWWQWNFSLAVDENPSFDQGNCENGANGQDEKVWFLTGVINVSGTSTRTCSVPVGGRCSSRCSMLSVPLLSRTVRPKPSCALVSTATWMRPRTFSRNSTEGRSRT